MDKFMHFVEDKMSPIADKLGEQRHLSAMQKGFMTVLPLIFVGAVFMVIANPPVTADMVKSGGVWSTIRKAQKAGKKIISCEKRR